MNRKLKGGLLFAVAVALTFVLSWFVDAATWHWWTVPLCLWVMISSGVSGLLGIGYLVDAIA